MFLKDISPSLKVEVKIHIFAEVIKLNEVFKTLLDTNDNDAAVITYCVRKMGIELEGPEKVFVK